MRIPACQMFEFDVAEHHTFRGSGQERLTVVLLNSGVGDFAGDGQTLDDGVGQVAGDREFLQAVVFEAASAVDKGVVESGVDVGADQVGIQHRRDVAAEFRHDRPTLAGFGADAARHAVREEPVGAPENTVADTEIVQRGVGILTFNDEVATVNEGKLDEDRTTDCEAVLVLMRDEAGISGSERNAICATTASPERVW